MDATMPAYKDKKRGSWYVAFYYEDYTGKRKHTTRRGFPTKREAQACENEFMAKLSKSSSITFKTLVEAYMQDMSTRLKPTTMDNKWNIINNHLIPAFGNRIVSDIDVADVRAFQHELMSKTVDGKAYSQTFLKTVNTQLSAIFNYSIKVYGLQKNVVRLAGPIGRSNANEMRFYTKEQFDRFIAAEKKPAMKLAFDTLFWTGMRCGELLALTEQDIGSDRIYVTKNFAVVKGQHMILTPKTEKSRREITVPASLIKEFHEYIDKLYGYKPDERIFYFTRSALEKEVVRVADLAGLPHIRVHDFRHSHVALLIHMDIPISEISKRLGHESVKTTWDTYGHLYPGSDVKLANDLDRIRDPGADGDDGE